jgi:hypothetical protein
MVATKLLVVVNLSPTNIPLCADVIVIPDDRRIIVFHNGKPHASNVIMYFGGQIQPIPIHGDKLQ